MSGFKSSITPSMPVRHLLVMVESVWRGVMMLRSASAVRPNTSMTLSSISRCCAVTQQRLSISSRVFNSLTSGAILMASGRVPNTLMMRSLSILFLFSLVRVHRGVQVDVVAVGVDGGVQLRLL